LAAYAFVYNIWRTIDGTPQRRAATPTASATPPVVPLRRQSAK